MTQDRPCSRWLPEKFRADHYFDPAIVFDELSSCIRQALYDHPWRHHRYRETRRDSSDMFQECGYDKLILPEIGDRVGSEVQREVRRVFAGAPSYPYQAFNFIFQIVADDLSLGVSDSAIV